MVKREKKSGICTYCGKQDRMTKDHIPPKCLFAKPRPSDLITVPCCQKCNQAASADDEYFRSRLLPRHDIAEHPEAAILLPDVMRSLTREGAGGFGQEFFESLRQQNVYTPAGLYLGKHGVYQVKHARIERVIARIVRGLFHLRYGARLSDEHMVGAFSEDSYRHLSEEIRARWRPTLDKIAAEPLTTIGRNNVFAFRSVRAADESSSTLWVLGFYDAYGFIGYTMPKSALPRRIR